MCICMYVYVYFCHNTVVALWIIYIYYLWGVACVYGICIVALFISEGILLQ